MQYIYPQNLKSEAKLWLWSLRDFAISAVAALLSVLALVRLGLYLPLAVTLCFAFASIRFDDMTVLTFLKRAARFFLTAQQYYEWGLRDE